MHPLRSKPPSGTVVWRCAIYLRGWQVRAVVDGSRPASEQKQMFDPVAEGERALHYLENIGTGPLFSELAQLGLAAAIHVLAKVLRSPSSTSVASGFVPTALGSLCAVQCDGARLLQAKQMLEGFCRGAGVALQEVGCFQRPPLPTLCHMHDLKHCIASARTGRLGSWRSTERDCQYRQAVQPC